MKACTGDSGGALICQDPKDDVRKQYGIVSWSIGCAKPQYPTVYARILAQRKWIKIITGI